MNWQKQTIDKTYVINLAKRTDRLWDTRIMLNAFNIDFEVWEAIEDNEGRVGLLKTMISLFEHCLENNYREILVFEDDIEFIADPNETMVKVMEQLPLDYDLLFLGANIFKPFNGFQSDNLIRLTGAVANHAVLYSRQSIKQILPVYKQILSGECNHGFTDVALSKEIVSKGNSYIVYPLLSVQREGYSDIEKRRVNYHTLLNGRYHEQLKKAKKYKE